VNQTTFESSGAGLTQNDRILTRLSQAEGAWVGLPDLVACSGAYAVHSRVADLRKAGYVIEQESVRRAGKVHSFYRLASMLDS
jgi:hypothetical protein